MKDWGRRKEGKKTQDGFTLCLYLSFFLPVEKRRKCQLEGELLLSSTVSIYVIIYTSNRSSFLSIPIII
jgi:hypothetical protein